MSSRLRPLGSDGANLRIAPFAVLACAAFATVPLPPSGHANGLELALAAALTIAIVLGSLVAPWRRLPAWSQAFPALAYFGVVVLLRDAEGGAISGFEPLVLLPIVWLALYGARRDLLVALAFVGAVFIAPILLIGPPVYPASEWRLAIVWLLATSTVGWSVQTLVADIRERTRTQSAVSRLMRELPGNPDARSRICDALCELTGAPKALLLESDGRGSLVGTAMAGMRWRRLSIKVGRDPSGAALTLTAREPLFYPDLQDNPTVARDFHRTIGACSALFHPVMRGDQAVGVVAVFWTRLRTRIDDRVANAVALMASEAGVAIERADLLERLEQQAKTDSLTGLPNRRVWHAELEREMSRARRATKPLCIALLDLDGFKQYNDANGHPAGDRLLKEAAAKWGGELRDVDLLARYGGDEFAAFLHECELDEAREVIERIRVATPAGTTCSAGIAAWDGAETLEELTARADAALYDAKRAGRARAAAAAPAHR